MAESPETGSERIAAAFAAARDEGRAALMPYMVGGYPDQETANAVAGAYAEAGADLIELGVPFSDPLADGPVIHAAATTALEAGSSLDLVLETCSTISEGVPILLMVYANMVLARGVEKFASAAAEAGAAGAIVPDLSHEESPPIRAALEAEGLALVPLVAPTTPPERRRLICATADGFVYIVSLIGVTGERGELPAELNELVDAVRSEATVPAAVGFGIGTAEQAARVGEIADGVIIGSRLVRAVGEAGGPDEAARAARTFITDCHEAMGRESSRDVR